MTQIALVKVPRKEQMTIPVARREDLQIEPGDYVVLRPLMGGILISKATVTPDVQAEDILRGLVTSMGRAAEQQGIHSRRPRQESNLRPKV
jgi:AbrB family looped-hinge helix DNA binding protein